MIVHPRGCGERNHEQPKESAFCSVHDSNCVCWSTLVKATHEVQPHEASVSKIMVVPSQGRMVKSSIARVLCLPHCRG